MNRRGRLASPVIALAVMLVEDSSAVWKRLFEGRSDAFLDHSSEPHNIGSIDDADVCVSLTGPCGESIELWLKEESGIIADIKFIPDGCEGTVACGSALTELAKGKSLGEAAAISASLIEHFLGGLAEEHKHCAALAASVLHKGLAELVRKMKRSK